MALKIEFDDEAIKALDKMDQYARVEIIKRINDFATTGVPSPKPLTGSLRGLHRLRFGKKRVIIRLSADSAEIVAIDSRDKVYKR
ncbi:MAG: hypothetical protein LBC09_04045 [Helicobacteraceae bacterium]|jgi:mRNA-degrading endonuclease RelE of RelBE toxin-antitoxin system|nr:hypothetical protein [Helicobacteraceae bacterium]